MKLLMSFLGTYASVHEQRKATNLYLCLGQVQVFDCFMPLALLVFSKLNHLPDGTHGSLPFWTLTLLDQALDILLLEER